MTSPHGLADLPLLVDTEIAVSRWRTLAQADIDVFAELTDDRQWIHVDAEAAAAGPFGATIAHGYLTLALIGGLWAEGFDVRDAAVKVNYGMDRTRFVTPVRAGERVRLRSHLAEAVPHRGGFRLHVDQTMELEGSPRPALVSRCLYDFLPASDRDDR